MYFFSYCLVSLGSQRQSALKKFIQYVFIEDGMRKKNEELKIFNVFALKLSQKFCTVCFRDTLGVKQNSICILECFK